MAKFNGRTDKEGKLTVFHKKEMAKFLKSLPGKYFKIVIEEEGNWTDPQWGYLHASLGILAKALNETGNNLTIETLKDILREKCPELRESVYIDGVFQGDRRRSTKELNKEEMSIVIERMIAFASELGVVIPEPMTQTKAF